MALIKLADTKPWYQVAEAIRAKLQSQCPRLFFTVYAEYMDADWRLSPTKRPTKESFHIIAKHPTTHEVRFQRLIPLEELLTQEGSELLLSQLWLVEPPT